MVFINRILSRDERDDGVVGEVGGVGVVGVADREEAVAVEEADTERGRHHEEWVGLRM